MADNLTRLTVNLTPRAAQALSAAAATTGFNKTDVINRALSVYAYVEAVMAGGGALYVRELPGDEARELKLL